MAEIQRDSEPQRSLGRRESIRIVSRADENDAGTVLYSKRKRMTEVDETTLEEVIQFVRKRSESVVTLEEKLDIKQLKAMLRFEHSHKQELLSPVGKKSKSNAPERIGGLLNCKKRLVGKILLDYWNFQLMVSASAREKYEIKSTLVPDLAVVRNGVQTLVRNLLMTETRPVAGDIMNVLRASGFIKVSRESFE